jgi:hypothetical protein
MPEPKKPSFIQRAIMRVAKSVGADSYLQQMAPQRTSSVYSGLSTFGGPIDKRDLLFAVQREPTGHRVVFDVAHDVFDKGFTIENLDDKNDKDLDAKVQAELSRLNAKDVCTQVVAMERIYGWAVLGYQFQDSGEDLKEPATNISQIERLIPYYDSNISQVVETTDPESDRYGLPEFIEVNLKVGGKKMINYTRFYWLATRLLGHAYQGQSALEPILDDLTVLRNIRWGIGMTMIRYGSGFPDVELAGADLTAVNAFIESGQFNNLSAMKYFVHNTDQKLEFKGMGSSVLDPEKYVLPILESISLGSGIPLAILRGVQAGALTGSEVNEREYFRLISDIQGRVEPMVRDLVNKILNVLFNEGKAPPYRIQWQGLVQQSEEDKLKNQLQKERINELRTNYMTVNEIRESELGPESGRPDGDVILALLKGEKASIPKTALPAGMETDEEAVTNLQNTLTIRLQGLVNSAKESKMSEDEALLAAEITIEEHVNSMKKIAKLNISQKLNRPIGELSPENQKDFAVLKKGLLDDFKRILRDAMNA